MVGMDEIGVYIDRHQNMFAQYIATHPIMDFCLAAEWKPGLKISRQWWENTALDILGIRAWHTALEVGEVDGDIGIGGSGIVG